MPRQECTNSQRKVWRFFPYKHVRLMHFAHVCTCKTLTLHQHFTPWKGEFEKKNLNKQTTQMKSDPCSCDCNIYTIALTAWKNIQDQRAKKVMSDSLGLVEFAIGQVLFFGEIHITEGLLSILLIKKGFGASWNDLLASTCYLQLARMAGCKTDFLCTLRTSTGFEPETSWYWCVLDNTNLEMRLVGQQLHPSVNM